MPDKWLLLGDFQEAKKILEDLATGESRTVLPYHPNRRSSWPPLPTFEDKARFYLAAIHDLENDHETAKLHYSKLLDLKPASALAPVDWRDTYVDLRAYLHSLLTEPYRGGAWEVYRIRDAQWRVLGSRLPR